MAAGTVGLIPRCRPAARPPPPILADRRLPCEGNAARAPRHTRPACGLLPLLVMTLRRAAGLCLILAALLGTGCAGRHRLSTVRGVAVHGLTSRFADAGTNGRKDSAAALGRNSPDIKATGTPQTPQLPSGSSAQLPVERPVGTSGKWVVTAITQRPDGPAAAASTHSVMSEAGTSRALWLMAVALLALVICLVVIARAASSSRRA